MWYIDSHKKFIGHGDQLIELPWLKGTLIILGHGAIIINVLFLLICFIFTAFKMKYKVATWMIVLNIIIFFAQVYFFFF